MCFIPQPTERVEANKQTNKSNGQGYCVVGASPAAKLLFIPRPCQAWQTSSRGGGRRHFARSVVLGKLQTGWLETCSYDNCIYPSLKLTYPLNMVVANRNLLSWVFSGAMSVSFRFQGGYMVMNLIVERKNKLQEICPKLMNWWCNNPISKLPKKQK